MNPKTKTLLFILVSFVLGALVGGATVRYWSGLRTEGRYQNQADVMKAFAERLHLNDQQVAQVDTILEQRRKKFDQFRNAMIAVRDTTRQEIRKLLTPEQNKLFDEYVQEMNAREERRRTSHPGR